MSERSKSYAINSNARIPITKELRDRWSLTASIGGIQMAKLDHGALLIPHQTGFQLVEALVPDSQLHARVERRLRSYLEGSTPLPQGPIREFEVFTNQTLTSSSLQLQIPRGTLTEWGSPKRVNMEDYNSGWVIKTPDNITDTSQLVPVPLLEEGAWLHDRQGRLAALFGDVYTDWVNEVGTQVFQSPSLTSSELPTIAADETQLGAKIKRVITRDIYQVVAKKAAEQVEE